MAENVIKETKEEAGLDVAVDKVIAVQDWRRHNACNLPYGIIKIFVLCRGLGGRFFGFEKWNFLKLSGEWILFVRLFFPDSLVFSVSDRIFCQQTVISEKSAFVFGNGEE